jgi:hypothetical protein
VPTQEIFNHLNMNQPESNLASTEAVSESKWSPAVDNIFHIRDGEF